MIHEYEITIGSILRTNKGEIIRVESISTKRQHRKVGYHTSDDPYRIKYVRLAQCEGVELTPEILIANGFDRYKAGIDQENFEIGTLISDRILLYYTKEEKFWAAIGGNYPIIKYVHQLQFALICAGLQEMAIKLKVE